MQAQVKGCTQGVLSSQQSLQSVHTLLRAGLGCITYLRNLLPADNFSESFLTSANSDQPLSQGASSFSTVDGEPGNRNVSGFKIMTVTRGYTEEADKLLDYLENGIFDALQHQYLRSFIFAIYLDSDDPNNIIEAYTFNFSYYSLPGTDTTIPVMSLGEDLMKLSLSASGAPSDPIAEATRRGRVPTLGEVKKSLKTLVKNLIQATTQMDPLPKRRYATFKLFYHDHTPDDYEPPHFRAGDYERDKWFFTTHSRGEVPEKCSVGTVQTGWHDVDVRIASVSGYLPSTEDNNAPFLGTTACKAPMAPALTPAEESAARVQQAEIQRKDAAERRVAWDAEDESLKSDAVEKERIEDESQDITSLKTGPLSTEAIQPIGMRDSNGTIMPIDDQPEVTCRENETLGCNQHVEGHYMGAEEEVPSRVGQMFQSMPRPPHLEETQQLDPPFIAQQPQLSSSLRPIDELVEVNIEEPTQSLPPSDVEAFSLSSISSADADEECVAAQMPTEQGPRDSEMLDLETQVPPSQAADMESISSFSDDRTVSKAREAESSAEDITMKVADEETTEIECECGVTLDDTDIVHCDGPCGKWFHLWCMGYHNIQQLQGDTVFICFDCRVRADKNWVIIKLHDLYPRIMERFRSLALYRRAIKLCETFNPPGLAPFIKLIGCENVVAGQLFKRLESEGFIAQEIVEQDAAGLMETTTRRPKGKGTAKGNAKRKQSVRVQGQKSHYVFVEAMKKEQAYIDYFSPDPQVEARILEISDMKPKRTMRNSTAADEVPFRDAINDPSDAQTTGCNGESSADGAVAATHDADSQTQLEEDHTVPDDPEDPSRKLAVDPGASAKSPVGADGPEKRKHSDSAKPERTAKKVKISLGQGVDLGD